MPNIRLLSNMSCPIQRSNYEPIADELLDHRLIYQKHNVYTHLGCVILRSAIGLTLINKTLSEKDRCTAMILIIIALIIFGSKYIHRVVIQRSVFWKAYLRMLVAYSSALYLIWQRKESHAGLLIIADALMGLQSRHLASVLTCGINPLG